MEEGKLNAILSGFDRDNFRFHKSERDKSKKQDPAESVAKNVVQYIQMKEAGHLRYGIAFLVSQVK